MIYDIYLKLEIQADSDKEAKKRIQDLLQDIMRIERRELGLEHWEFVQNEKKANNSS